MGEYTVSKTGYFGEFGGAYIPEILQKSITELQKNYLSIITDKNFQKEFRYLLENYAGRKTPLYYAQRISEHYQTKIYLKREDLLHTGAHKINNCLGQILLAKKMGKSRIIAETGAGQHGSSNSYSLCIEWYELHYLYGRTRYQKTKIQCRKNENFRC